MIRVAIAEDDPICTERLQDYLERYGRENAETVEITLFSDGAELVEDYRPNYDLLLLDIEMPHLDGMTAAEKIRRLDSEVSILFVTNMAKYAIKGYEVDALGFMLKPVSYFQLALKLKKVQSCLQSRSQRSLMIPTEDGIKKLPAADVHYVEVLDHRLHLHTDQQVYITPGSLRDLEAELAGQHFVRCNKGYLVNLRHIELIRDDCVVMANGDKLLISRRKREGFLLAVTGYYGKGGR